MNNKVPSILPMGNPFAPRKLTELANSNVLHEDDYDENMELYDVLSNQNLKKAKSIILSDLDKDVLALPDEFIG